MATATQPVPVWRIRAQSWELIDNKETRNPCARCNCHPVTLWRESGGEALCGHCASRGLIAG